MSITNDLRSMSYNEVLTIFPDEGASIDECIDMFIEKYMAYIGNLPLKDFCKMYGHSLDYITALEPVEIASRKGHLASLLNDTIVGSIDILGHYRYGRTHIFPYLPHTVYYDEISCKEICSFVCVYLTDDGYGLAPYIINNNFSLVTDNIRTLKDVYQFLKKKSDIASYPVLVM